MRSYNVCVAGSGYVGLVTGTCLAELGHRVVCVDSDKRKLAALKAGKVPIYEPGLPELFAKHRKSGALRFAGSVKEGLGSGKSRAEIVFIAVGTPPRADGSADLSAVETVACEIARNMKAYTIIVDKSTVPVETGEWVSKTVARINKGKVPYDVVSNPEFLSEGSAVKDFLQPDRIVLGVTSARAEKIMRGLYAPLKAPVLVTDVKSAELIKHASNSFLATKISYINAVSALCEKVGADVSLVAHGMGLDRRIGPMFLRPGVGFGGFCLPPDETVLARDPSGKLRAVSMSALFTAAPAGEGVWELLSLDAERDRLALQPVSAVAKRPYDGLLIEVKTPAGSVVATSDHPFLVRGPRGWRVLTAAELVPGDQLPASLEAARRKLAAVPAGAAAPAVSALNDELALVSILSCRRHRYNGMVYSVEVAETESFALANGVLVHNCFPKDLEAFYWISKRKGYDFSLLKTVKEINEHQKGWVLRKIEEKLWNVEGKSVAVLGLAFKPHTDDMRFAPSLDIIRSLRERRVAVSATDPAALARARELPELKGVKLLSDPYACAKGADALVVVTEWPEYKELDLKRLHRLMRNPLILDGRNLFDPETLRRAGFNYCAVGRPDGDGRPG